MSAEAGNFDARQELQLNLDWTKNEVNTQTDMMPRCTSFGFEEGTDGHANCVMELQIAEDALAQARQLAEETQNEINQRLDGIEDAREKATAISAGQRPAAGSQTKTFGWRDVNRRRAPRARGRLASRKHSAQYSP